MLGGRKVRSNKGKKRGSYGSRSHIKVLVSPGGTRHIKKRKIRSNKGKKRNPYGPRTGITRSGKKFRKLGGAIHNNEMKNCKKHTSKAKCNKPCHHETLKSNGESVHIQSCVWKNNECISSESEKSGEGDYWVPLLKCKAAKKKHEMPNTQKIGVVNHINNNNLKGEA